jgi:putative oxidoreductase
MKTAVTTTRIITGALYAFSAVAYFFNLLPQEQMDEPMKSFVLGLVGSGYFMPFLKIVELAGGLALLIPQIAPLATVILFPITINIFLFHAFLAPEQMVIPLLLLAANLFLVYAYTDRYKPMVSHWSSN